MRCNGMISRHTQHVGNFHKTGMLIKARFHRPKRHTDSKAFAVQAETLELS